MEFMGFYLDAFRELSSCRNSTMGLGPIPFTAIKEYATIFCVDNFEEFLYIIRVMDNTYIESNSKKGKSKNAKRPSK